MPSLPPQPPWHSSPVSHSSQMNLPSGAADSPRHSTWKCLQHSPSQETRESPVLSQTCRGKAAVLKLECQRWPGTCWSAGHGVFLPIFWVRSKIGTQKFKFLFYFLFLFETGFPWGALGLVPSTYMELTHPSVTPVPSSDLFRYHILTQVKHKIK